MRRALQKHQCLEKSKNKKNYLRVYLHIFFERRKKQQHGADEKVNSCFFRLWNVWAWADIKQERPLKGETVNRTRTYAEEKTYRYRLSKTIIWCVTASKHFLSLAYFLDWPLIFGGHCKTYGKLTINLMAINMRPNWKCRPGASSIHWPCIFVWLSQCTQYATTPNKTIRIELKKTR